MATAVSYYSREQLDRIAGLIQRDTTIFLTASNFGKIVEGFDPETLTDKARKPTPQNCTRINIRAKHILTVVNSTSDNHAALDGLNRLSEIHSGFVWARDRFAIDPKNKRDPLEWVDPKSTHEVPDDLIKEISDRAEKGGINHKQQVKVDHKL